MFNWLAFLTYAFITAATPGPNNIMSMSNGGRLGFRGALPFNFGIWAGFSAVMLLCTAFCTTLTNLIPAVKTPMLIAGAAYMLHLAWGTFRSSGVIDEDHSRSGFYAGMLLQFIITPECCCNLSTPRFISTALCRCRRTFCPFTQASR